MDWTYPSEDGRFGDYGGKFIPEVLVPVFREVEEAYRKAKSDPEFQKELSSYLRDYGRPTPLYFAKNLSKKLGANIYLKREDLLHGGAHKGNNCVGQALLAKYMGKKRVIAETGAGQHGAAIAMACAMLGLECVVYMGEVDMERQSPNVLRMKLCGAEVVPVKSGQRTLKDAINEAIRDWISNVETTYYCIGSVVSGHPYPLMVRDFQSIIGRETKEQMEKLGKKPDALVACVGGGSNAIGLFYPFIEDEDIQMFGIEPAGRNIENLGEHAASLLKGRKGILHGMLSYLLQTEEGQVAPVHSISAGLDYPGVGPEHSLLKDMRRVKYDAVTDDEALSAFKELSETEGIIPALESAHATAYLEKIAGEFQGKNIVVCLSGRGDKDLGIISQYFE